MALIRPSQDKNTQAAGPSPDGKNDQGKAKVRLNRCLFICLFVNLSVC